MSALAEDVMSVEEVPVDSRQEPEYDIAIQHAIERIRKRSPDDVKLVKETECFARWWRDENGVCPNDGVNGAVCDLRLDCEASFLEAQSRIKERLELEAAPPEKVQEIKEERKERKQRAKEDRTKARIDGEKKEAKKKPPKEKKAVVASAPRGKWRETGKYQRLGYSALNRPVDRALAVFLQALGNPPSLPKVWSPVNFHDKYGGLGPIVTSQTASYTSVLANGVTVVRCWTNAGNCMLIDVVPDLIVPISNIKGVGGLRPVPDGSLKKLRPCTHRFELTFNATLQEEVLTAIGAMVRFAYQQKSPP